MTLPRGDLNTTAPLRVTSQPAALVHQPVMVAAERHQVLKAGFAAVGPVLDVMAVGVAGVRATGEAAGAVSYPQRSQDRGRNGARLAADRERFALYVFDDGTVEQSPPMRRDISAGEFCSCN